MSCKMVTKGKKYIAKLSDKQAPCAFCKRTVHEETTFGKLYSIGDIHCHYFCVLLSCCLIQKGKDEEGLFGFLYPDILAEIERSKKHKCSYCNKDGATLGCSVAQCRKQFHLPCGREKSAVSLFFGNYKSFCKDHAPKQKIPNNIMEKARVRKTLTNKIKRYKLNVKEDSDKEAERSVCVICYEVVDGFPTVQTFWPPCCARDAWFHRNCIERMALSAGVHYLKCPLCNDKDIFYKAVLQQGYYVPDRDAAWELEQNAYSDMYERQAVCCVEQCKCPDGREFDAESGQWDISACLLCGGGGAHRGCAQLYVCAACERAGLSRDQLRDIQRVPLPSQNQTSRIRNGPIMPSRMSLRRTKLSNIMYMSSTSTHNLHRNNGNFTPTEESRLELNLKPPKKRTFEDTSHQKADKFCSPVKLIEMEIKERFNTNCIADFDDVLTEVVEKLRKPRPLVEKKKIVHNIIEGLMSNLGKENTKANEVMQWNSPKKSLYDENENPQENINLTPKKGKSDSTELSHNENLKIKNIEQKTPTKTISKEEVRNIVLHFVNDTPKLKKINIQSDSMEISENDEIVNIDLVKIKDDISQNTDKKEKCLKFNPFEENLEKDIDIDVESFKNQYLNEVDRKFSCNFEHKHKHTNNQGDSKKLKTAIDFEVNSLNKPPKRKLPSENNVARKKRKTTKLVQDKKYKNKTEVSIRNKNFNFRIKWKNEELNLKISNLKKKNRRGRRKKVLKQYVLSPQADGSEIITRPTNDVSPIKRKYVKTEKMSDNLKQTSIASFFKVKMNE